jgi:putative flavoprotein involved in K+ transport
MTTAATSGVSSTAKRVTCYETIVVGGGQAGLAIGYHLAARGLDFVILDAAPRLGDSWRRRWDSLRLFTPARYSSLPGMAFPDSPSHLPDKDQVADYLERYAERFELPVRLHTQVTSLDRVGTDFVLETSAGIFEAKNVVVATGPFQRPKIPGFATELRSDVVQLHSSSYRNPFELPIGDVLVVGAGNSGAQIALELSRVRNVTLAGRDIGRLPRTILGADVFSWLWPAFRRLHLDTSIGRRLRRRSRSSDPLIGINPRDFAAHGVRRVGPVTEVRDGLPHVDGAAIDVKTVIWATGFAPDFSWIRPPALGPDGAPRQVRGVSAVEGLYFLGQRFQYRQSSALIGGVGVDAEFIAGDVARRTSAAEPAASPA